MCYRVTLLLNVHALMVCDLYKYVPINIIITLNKTIILTIETLLVMFTILDGKLTKFDVIMHQHLVMTHIVEICENIKWS